jgi:hypothetical protein
MRRFLSIPLCCVALLAPATLRAGEIGGFNAVLDSIESRYHAHATRIPFLGLISFIARKSTHESVANLHVAEFDSFAAEVDGAELSEMIENKLGAGWERMIRETCRHGDNQTLVFIRPEGQRMGLFVVDKNGNEMDVVEVSVNPDHLDDDIAHYRHHHGRDDSD